MSEVEAEGSEGWVLRRPKAAGWASPLLSRRREAAGEIPARSWSGWSDSPAGTFANSSVAKNARREEYVVGRGVLGQTG
ncbi:hypothetical protein ANO11243_033280 [Dothideomycetidae sp. 11243]|nr:hypothetical protein ANO11243_033280 [fungal sp. No.11243]